MAGKGVDDTISNDECFETNNSGARGKQNKGRKKKQKGNDSAGEKLVTSAEVHVDADLSSMDTRGLLMTLISQTQQNFDIMGRRMESLENNLEKKLTDKMNKAIDRRINTETNKFKKEIDKNVSDLRKEFDNEIEDITEKVNRVTNQIEQLDGVSVARPEKEDIKLNIVVRKLPETSRENLNNKVNSLIKDGLKLRDIEVKSVERKKSYHEGKPGLVIAQMQSLGDKKKILASKSSLKHSRVYKDVYIHSDQTKEERMMSANLRSLVSAYKAGDSNIRVMGSRIVRNDQEGNSNGAESYRRPEAYDNRNSNRDTAEYQTNCWSERSRARNSSRDRNRDIEANRGENHERRDEREYHRRSDHNESRDYQRRDRTGRRDNYQGRRPTSQY